MKLHFLFSYEKIGEPRSSSRLAATHPSVEAGHLAVRSAISSAFGE
jgi:hypothetical protein